MDALIDEALIVGDWQARDLALEIRAREDEHQDERRSRLWNLGDMIDNIKRPYLTFSDIVTVVEAAPDEEAQLQAVMARLEERGEWDPLVAELAIATVGLQDTDAIVEFLNSLVIDKKEHITTACGKKLVECVACEEQLPPKDLILASCGHCYCESCLNMVFNAAISDESLYPPRCCAQTPIPIEHAKRFLDPEFERTFEEKGVEFNTVDRTYCSDPTCSTFIPPATIHSGTAYCWNCDKATCVVCKSPAHDEDDCPTDLEFAALLNYAEKMRWQRCYDCLRTVEREDGCNHMRCRCRANFCYNCGKLMDGGRFNCHCSEDEDDPLTYRFYRRDEDGSQPPYSAITIQDVPHTADPAFVRARAGTGTTNFLWIGVPEENPAELEQDRSRPGTPDTTDVVAPQAADPTRWTNDGERSSIASSRRSRTPDVDAAQDVTLLDADPTVPSGTSGDVLIHMARQLLLGISAQYWAPLNQAHENEAVVNTSSAILAPELAPEWTPELTSDDLNPTADEDSQHTRSQRTSEDTPRQEGVSDVQLSDDPNSGEEPAQSDRNDEDVSVYQTSYSSTISVKPTRHGRLRTRLSPHRLLRVLRKVAVKLPSDEKKIVSKNDQDRLDDEDVLEGDGRWSTTRTLAVAMKTTMGSESG
ncbi:hypothetical protein KCU78_g11729, partial [Aureobasidium melanogenum]